MNANNIVGILLIIFGLLHLIKPLKMQEFIKKFLKDNPGLKNEKQRVARPGFIIAFGVSWIFVGLCVIFLGP